MKLNISLEATLDVPDPVQALLQIEAAEIPGAQIIESSELYISPYVEAVPYKDHYINPCRKVEFLAGECHIAYRTVVEIPDKRGPMIQAVETDIMEIPTDIIHYLLPSRYCLSDRLQQLAFAEFGQTAPGYARVQNICGWINEHVKYEYGFSTTATTAFDTATERIGVCRDFAHLGIALCRAMNIPARYVSGYCLDLDPPDMHAYFQAYLDGRWVNFDATSVQPRPALVTVAIGRDAADCAWCSFFGNGSTKNLNVGVSVAG